MSDTTADVEAIRDWLKGQRSRTQKALENRAGQVREIPDAGFEALEAKLASWDRLLQGLTEDHQPHVFPDARRLWENAGSPRVRAANGSDPRAG